MSNSSLFFIVGATIFTAGGAAAGSMVDLDAMVDGEAAASSAEWFDIELEDGTKVVVDDKLNAVSSDDPGSSVICGIIRSDGSLASDNSDRDVLATTMRTVRQDNASGNGPNTGSGSTDGNGPNNGNGSNDDGDRPGKNGNGPGKKGNGPGNNGDKGDAPSPDGGTNHGHHDDDDLVDVKPSDTNVSIVDDATASVDDLADLDVTIDPKVKNDGDWNLVEDVNVDPTVGDVIVGDVAVAPSVGDVSTDRTVGDVNVDPSWKYDGDKTVVEDVTVDVVDVDVDAVNVLGH